MSSGFLVTIFILLIWASLGSIYWQIRRGNEKQLKALKNIEKRLAALEKQLS